MTITNISRKDTRPKLSILFDYDEQYEFQKLYDILTDMDFELTARQHRIFEKVRDAEIPPIYPEPQGDPSF